MGSSAANVTDVSKLSASIEIIALVNVALAVFIVISDIMTVP